MNNCLARINGMPAIAHLGVNVTEIFGEISRKTAEPAYRHVFQSGEKSHFEVNGAVLPTRPGTHFWALNTNFPIRDRTGEVREIGILVVDVTAQKKLEQFLRALEGSLRCSETRQAFWWAEELRASIDQYHSALATSLELLWKEIGDYLDRGIRTVQRWESTLSLPVHRLGPGKRSAVFAFPSELLTWLRTIAATHTRPAALVKSQANPPVSSNFARTSRIKDSRAAERKA